MQPSFKSTVVAGAFALGFNMAWADDKELKDLPPDAKLMGEQHTIAVLSKPDPKRIYVLEPIFPVFIASKVWVIDGAKQQVLGMLSGGYAPNMSMAPDHSQLYLAETYWSKGYRGTRSDMITFFDPLTLNITAEVELPKGRFLVVPKKPNSDTSTDGRYIYSYNLAPATTVSVVDAKEKKYKGEIEIPGCGLIFPSAGNRFSTVCSDGTLLTVTFDANLKATTTREPAFFDSENDPVFEHAVLDKKRSHVHFISYEGSIITADLSKPKPQIMPKWSLLTDDDKKESWRPGGWQLMALHKPTQQLYVLMHKGPMWSHKTAGEEVWVFDLKTKKRIARHHLKEHAISVAVSQDADPYFYTQTEKAMLVTYNAKDGKEVGEMAFGISPYLIYTDGD